MGETNWTEVTLNHRPTVQAVTRFAEVAAGIGIADPEGEYRPPEKAYKDLIEFFADRLRSAYTAGKLAGEDESKKRSDNMAVAARDILKKMDGLLERFEEVIKPGL